MEMRYANPNTDGAVVSFKEKYDNYIGGKYVPPTNGQYFDNVTPVTGEAVCQIARSTKEDVELALDAAYEAKDAWGKTSPTERDNILDNIEDVIEEHLEMLAVAENWDNGKDVRETLEPDLP